MKELHDCLFVWRPIRNYAVNWVYLNDYTMKTIPESDAVTFNSIFSNSAMFFSYFDMIRHKLMEQYLTRKICSLLEIFVVCLY